MKKILMLATAAAMLVPAFAQAETYSDAISTFGVSAPVQNFCRFGDTSNGATTGVNVVSTNGNADTGDQNFVVDIQKDSDNTVQNAKGGFKYDRFVCNTPFNVVANSTNGGLKSSAPAATGFLSLVPYTISFGTSSSAFAAVKPVVTGPISLLAASAPQAASATFSFNIPASSGLLLQGTYTDTIVLTMSPVTGVSI